MDRILAFNERPSIAPNLVAVAIGPTGQDQRHVGIMHQSDREAESVLHLAWHFRLSNDHPIPDYFQLWIEPRLPLPRQRNLAALCRRIWKKHGQGGIPYAFSDPQNSLDPVTGEILLGPTRFGLTCASFVLAVFEAAGVPLIQYNHWPIDRPGDREWQERVVLMLMNRAEPDHIEHLRHEIGSVRYRPEEVAAAVAIAPPPAAFQNAEQIAITIIERLSFRKS